MRGRSWRWLRQRILGLLTRPPTFVVLGHDDNKQLVTQVIYPNRVQHEINK